MTYKEKNMELVRKIISSAFWRAEHFPQYYTESFTMDFPSAPPGMPCHFSVWESERCFEWLNRTVKNWNVELEELYSTPNPDQFWAIGICRGNVFWGGQDGRFQSKFFARIELKDGKVNYLKGWMDTLAFLRAANFKFTPIVKGIFDPQVDKFLANPPVRLKVDKPKINPDDPYAGLDMSPGAIEERIQINLKQNICGIERETYRQAETFHPDYQRGAWFVPDDQPWCPFDEHDKSILRNSDMQKYMPKEFRPRIHAWVKSSSPWMYRDTRGVNFPTDDKLVYFAEMYSNGPSKWLGNGNHDGHYHQEYLMVMKFDEAGRELIRDEVICPLNKYNSANVSLPSFPYYL